MHFSLPSTLAIITFLSSLALSAPAAAKPTPRAPTYCPPSPASALEQRAIFASYVQTFYAEQDIAAAMNTFVANDLIQHNADIPNGRAAQLEAVAPIYVENDFRLLNVLFDDGFGMIFNELRPKNVTADGDGITTVVDIYRMEGSCLVEHWDVIQEVAANETKIPF